MNEWVNGFARVPGSRESRGSRGWADWVPGGQGLGLQGPRGVRGSANRVPGVCRVQGGHGLVLLGPRESRNRPTGSGSQGLKGWAYRVLSLYASI